MINPSILDEMVSGAVEALMWTSHDFTDGECDDSVNFLDTHSVDDIDSKSLEEFREAVIGCALTNLPDTITMLDFYATTSRGEQWSSGSLWGHDFTLTTNGHGAGFWDRGEASGAAERLTKSCVSSYDLYLGDDGKLYIS